MQRNARSIPHLDILEDRYLMELEHDQTDSIDWDLLNRTLDDSFHAEKTPIDETALYTTQVYHYQLKDKYQLLERNGIKCLDLFLREAVYSMREQDNILRLWLSYQESQDSGEELFSFLDEDYLGTDVYEKFVDFHISIVAQNQFGEVSFEGFFSLYRLLEIQFMSKNSILGSVFLKPKHQDLEWTQFKEKFLKSIEYVKVGEGELLFKQDDPLSHIYLIFYGKLQTYRLTKDGQKQIIGTITSGSYYGILELITEQKLVVCGTPANDPLTSTSYGLANSNKTVYSIKIPIDNFKELLTRKSTYLSPASNGFDESSEESPMVPERSKDFHFEENEEDFYRASRELKKEYFSNNLINTIVCNAMMNLQSVQTVLYSEALSLRNVESTQKHVKRNSTSERNLELKEILSIAFHNDPIVDSIVKMIQSNSKECAILKAKTGEYIYKNGSEPNELYVLLKGKASRILNLYFDKEVVLFPGSIMGEYSLLSGQNRSSSVRALTRCEYVKITREAIIELTSDKPLSLLSFPKAMATEIINHFKSLEYGYEYFTLRNGESCVRPGDTPNDFYFLVKGRLRESRPDNGKLIHIREYSIPGATIGITRLLENKPHNSLITAVRDTELVRLDKAWITQLMRTNPSGIQNLIRISLHHEDIERSNDEAMAPKRLVAIIPLYSQVPINGFTSHLVESLRKNAKVRVLSESSIVKKFGKIHNLDLLSNERQNVWHYITGQETINDFVICIAKPNLSPWTRWILQQVDCILVVGHANLNCSGLTEWERTLGLYDSNSYLAEKRLVLLHKPNATIKDTRIALEHRRIGNAPVTFHHHIYEGNQLHYDSIARFLSGTAVGLVLGGGGARGLTHIGVIQALHELGIPIDIVGGTSIGSQVGSLVANEMPASQISQRMCSTYSYLWKTQFGRYTDLTLPYLSLTTGSFVSSNFQKFLNGNSRIEDLRLPFFCVSCNLTKVEPKIHTSGILWEALRASSSLPLVFPPFVSEGDVLVDGGYVNNVPADIMRKIYGANVIIAVDVGDNYHITMDDSINNASGWKILFDTTFRGKSCVNIYEVLLHLAGITDWVNQVSRPKYVNIEIKPQLDESNGWLDFDQQDELVARGYNTAKEMLTNVKKADPSVSAAIIDKVNYPKEFLEPLVNVGQQKKLHWFHYLLSIIFKPKVLGILLSCYGVYQIALKLLSFFRAIISVSMFYKDLKNFLVDIWEASLPETSF